MGPYDDIIRLERPASRHPSMPRADRAKQFMPFASLRGYGDIIDDRQTLREPRRLLSEDEREAMDEQLERIADMLSRGIRPTVELQLFVADEQHSDAEQETGEYRMITGTANRLSSAERIIRVGRVEYSLQQIDSIYVTENK